MKRFVYFIALMFFFTIFLGNPAKAAQVPNVDSEGAVLMDAATGKLLYSKNPNESLAPASTTKVMTALVVLENADLNAKVTIGKNPPAVDGTRLGLIEGEVFTVNDLLHAMLLLSGNDCAVALAEYVGGSVEGFAEMMNKKAKEIGANNSHFTNPSGLYDENHKTTPYDLALITREAAKTPHYLEISQAAVYEFPPSNINGEKKWADNKNSLIRKNSMYYYPYALTGKTGYTIDAKHSYTSVAEKDGQRLIATFMRSDIKNSFFLNAKDLYEYGFNNFSLVKLYSKGQEVSSYEVDKDTTIPLLATQDVYYVTDKGQEKNVNSKVESETKDLSKTSFKRGEVILNSEVKVNNENYIALPLASGEDREVKPVATTVKESILNKNSLPVILSVGSFLGILFLLKYKSHIKRKKLRAKYPNIFNKKMRK